MHEGLHEAPHGNPKKPEVGLDIKSFTYGVMGRVILYSLRDLIIHNMVLKLEKVVQAFRDCVAKKYLHCKPSSLN